MESEEINFDKHLKIIQDTRKEIDAITSEIFLSHFTQLVIEPPSYVVCAVWGSNKNGILTSNQKAINEKIEFVINKLEPLLKLNALEPVQRYSIQCIMRELITTRLVFMVEMLREKVKGSEDNGIDLEASEPIGHA